MKVLLAAGAGVAVLGLIALLIGYPISDTSFGNAMMIDGVIVLCTGLLIMALSVVNGQLERIAKLLGDETVRKPLAGTSPLYPEPSAEPAAPLFPSAETPADKPTETAAPVMTPVAPAEPVPEPPPAAPSERPRRNLLFESRRRDRPEPKVLEPKPLEPLPPEPSKPSFDDAWSGGRLRAQTSNAHPAEPVAPETPAAPPVAAAPLVAPAPPVAVQPPAPAAPAAVTVIKSGTVDGMAYSLYSDGSIEAHMPKEGLIRFESLDALRDYLENKP